MMKFVSRTLVPVLVLALVFFAGSGYALSAGHGDAPDGFYAPETLAEFDGVETDEAYVAFEGRVYDLTEDFEDGAHAGHEAGQDLTDEAYEADHGPDVLEDEEVVGYMLEVVLTEEELARYDGEEYPPYVAVDNVIYDASEVFEDGTHGGNEAGQDLTEEFHDRHGEENLETMPVVGALVHYELTEEELAQYDGQDGEDGFVAVDGVIYDVTEAWDDGTHMGHEAGNDLSEEIGEAGHARTVLPQLPVVGVLVE